MPPTDPDRERRRLWRPGSFDAKRGADYLSVDPRTFRTIARSEKWPRKRVLGKVVYPRRLVWAYLAACPDAEPLSPAKPPTGNAAKRQPATT